MDDFKVLWHTLFIVFINFSKCTGIRNPPYTKTELQLVQLVFRHGDRAPLKMELDLYPKNPHLNETYPPTGLEAMTNAGKRNIFMVGEIFGTYYSDFLSRNYVPNEIYVRSTNTDRTKASAMIFLAALHPPTREEKWHPELNWLPITINEIFPSTEDDMNFFGSCPRFVEALQESISSDTEHYKANQDLFRYLSAVTGGNINNAMATFKLIGLLRAQESWGFPLPSWGSNGMMKRIEDASIYSQLNLSDELKKLAAGTLLLKMIKDFQAKINGTLSPANRKMFIYSAHDVNVAALLSITGVFELHQPPFGATFVLELHKMIAPRKYYAVRVLYFKDTNDYPKPLPIPNCGEYCEINRFIKLTANTVTSDFRNLCHSKSTQKRYRYNIKINT